MNIKPILNYFIKDYLLNIELIILDLYTPINNFYLEGTVSQIFFNVWHNFDSILKKGQIELFYPYLYESKSETGNPASD